MTYIERVLTIRGQATRHFVCSLRGHDFVARRPIGWVICSRCLAKVTE